MRLPIAASNSGTCSTLKRLATIARRAKSAHGVPIRNACTMMLNTTHTRFREPGLAAESGTTM